MGLSTNTYYYSGGTKQFSATFADGYLEQSHVTAYVVGAVDGLGNQVYLNFTWTSESQITVTDALSIGDEVTVERTVPKDGVLVDLDENGAITREGLARNNRQALHAVHEVIDGRLENSLVEAVNDLVAKVDEISASVAEASGAANEAASHAADALNYANSMAAAANSAATLLRNPTLTATGASVYSIEHDLPIAQVKLDGVDQVWASFWQDRAGRLLHFSESAAAGTVIEVYYGSDATLPAAAGVNPPVSPQTRLNTNMIRGYDEGVTLAERNKDRSTFAHRNVSDLISPMTHKGGLIDAVVLEKLRTTFGECAVYHNSVSNSTEWNRSLFSQRFNLGLDGLPRHLLTTVAGLYSTTAVARHPGNNVSEVRGSSPTVSKVSADGVTVGTWTTPATVLTTDDVTWSSTSGDSITFTITGVERVDLRGLVAGNGGVGKVTVTVGGVELADSLYLLPTDRLVNFLASATPTTTMHYPLAEGLDSAETYTVTVEVDSSNPAGGRVYIAGLLGFDDIAYDAVGVHGLLVDSSLGGAAASLALTPGTRTVYQLDNTTKVDWGYVKSPVTSISTLLLYDDTGALLETVTIDQYAVGSTATKVEVARDLPVGTYYLHAINGKVKNGSSSKHRFYETGVYKYDQTIPGVIGSDTFDTNDVPSNIVDPNQGSDWALIANGNLEYAPRVTKVGEASSSKTFVGGIHGHEVLNSITYYVDGEVIDYAGAAAGTLFVAEREIKMVADSTLAFASDDSPWASVTTTMVITKYGYTVKAKFSTVSDAVIFDDFIMMLTGPDTNMSGGTYGKSQGTKTGGGFEVVAMDKNYELNSYDGSGPSVTYPGRSMALVNGKYTVLCTFVETPDLPELFGTLEFSAGPDLGLIQDRSDNTIKAYIRGFVVGADGAVLPANTTWETSKHYTTIKGDLRPLIGHI